MSYLKFSTGVTRLDDPAQDLQDVGRRPHWVPSLAASRAFFGAVAIVLGFLQAYISRFDVDNDIISYMDMGEAYLRGDWRSALNGSWTPLLAWLWGITQRLTHPTAAWEYPAVHLLLFVVFLMTVACFDCFLNELILWKKCPSNKNDQSAVADYIWITIGYTVFLCLVLAGIGVGETTPDMLVAGFVFLASGIVLRIRRGMDGWAAYAALGAVLGLGYLAKAAFFLLALPILFSAFAWLPAPRKRVLRSAFALAIFLALSAPLIVARSLNRGYFAFGEMGRFNYAINVNEVAMRHWQGTEPGSGTPVHPTRRIFDHPAAYEFAAPLIGTYPFWYDPTYWYQGVRISFHPGQQAKAMAEGLQTIATKGAGTHRIFLALAILLILVSRGRYELSQMWPLLLIALSGLLMYDCVHVEPRYIAAFLALLYLSIFFGVRLPPTRWARRLVSASALIMLLLLLLPTPVGTVPYLYWLREIVSPKLHNRYYEAAKALQEMGVEPGDAVASVSYSNLKNVKYCRLARARIIAEVYWNQNDKESLKDNFWDAPLDKQQAVLTAFAAAGAKAALSDERPRGPTAGTWQQLGQTGFFIHQLSDH